MQNHGLPPVVEAFINLYNNYGTTAIQRFGEIYEDALVFEDPVHKISGLSAYQQYCQKIGKQCREINFECHSVICQQNQACINWTMRYRHPSLSWGKPITVQGCTLLHFDEKISYHRDYLDLGEMIYEHVPVLGRMIRKLKRRLAS